MMSGFSVAVSSMWGTNRMLQALEDGTGDGIDLRAFPYVFVFGR